MIDDDNSARRREQRRQGSQQAKQQRVVQVMQHAVDNGKIKNRAAQVALKIENVAEYKQALQPFAGISI